MTFWFRYHNTTIHCTCFFHIFCARTIINTIVYCNYQNIIKYNTLLVKNTESGLVNKMCLRFLELFPLWFQNRTNNHTLCNSAFSPFLNQWNQYYNSIQNLCMIAFYVGKRAASWPNTQTSMTYLLSLYIIRKKWIDTTSKVLDIQRLSLCLIWIGYQVLSVMSYLGNTNVKQHI